VSVHAGADPLHKAQLHQWHRVEAPLEAAVRHEQLHQRLDVRLAAHHQNS